MHSRALYERSSVFNSISLPIEAGTLVSLFSRRIKAVNFCEDESVEMMRMNEFLSNKHTYLQSSFRSSQKVPAAYCSEAAAFEERLVGRGNQEATREKEKAN